MKTDKERRKEAIDQLILKLVNLRNSNVHFEVRNSLINYRPYWFAGLEPEGFEWDGEQITVTIRKPGRTECQK